MVILTNPDGNEIKVIEFNKLDIDLNDQQDFEMRIPATYYTDEISYKGRIFVPETEYGGMIGGIETQTASDEIIITGRTWRGVLARKIIEPPAGQDYKVVSGDIGIIIGELISEQEIGSLFVVPPTEIGVSVTNYQFDRYITLLSGLEKMLKSVGHRLNMKYVQQERGQPGYLELTTVPIQNLGQQIELSQDSRLNFTFSETKNGVNHLICLGKGELADRVVIDMYIQEDGSIGDTQYYFGIDEVAAVYEDTSAETNEELAERGSKRLSELMSSQSFDMDVRALTIDVSIGDIVGGRDYATGLFMVKPVVNKIYKEAAGISEIEYQLGDETERYTGTIPGGGGGGGGGGDITVDSALSENSVNPVQNKVITLALQERAGNEPMEGATTSAAGKAGLVPAPSAGAATRYLRSDGSWQVPPDNDTTYEPMEGATASAAGKAGLVPAPSAGAATRYLRSDGTWQVPPNNDTTYEPMEGATTSAAGKAGLVPAPSAGAATRYLRSDGTWQVPPDNDTTYGTATTSAAGLMSAADKTKVNYTNIAYGTCSTAAATAAKVITVDGNTKWALTAGSVIIVKFSATNTAQNPTFNVNGTGAKSVWYNTALITTGSLGYAGTANRPMFFGYDGTQFIFLGWAYDANTTYSNASLGQGYGTCATAATTVAKVVTLSGYALVTGGIVVVKFTYAVPASATMNINNRGAKAIYYRGAAIAAGVIDAGDIATFIYNGSQYILLTVDKFQRELDSIITDTTISAFAAAGLPIT